MKGGAGRWRSTVSASTAQAVKSFFHSLPAPVAGHPEGIQAVEQIMALLEKLDTAATQVQATGQQVATAAAPQEDSSMQLDDEVLEQMAEAATAPAADGEAEEARTQRVAETKARLSTRRADLAAGLSKSKVRKCQQKA